MTLAKQWKQEGRQEDYKIGQQEALHGVAMKLLNQGMSLDQVSLLTDLTVEELTVCTKSC